MNWTRAAATLLGVLVVATAMPGTAFSDAPGWVSSPYDHYREDSYICAVGIGSDYETASNRARLELSRMFRARVRSDQVLREVYESKGLGDDVTEDMTQSINRQIFVTADEAVTNSRIVEQWFNERDHNHYVLAVIDRGETAMILSDEQDRIAEDIDSLVAASRRTDDPLVRIGLLTEAMSQCLAADAIDRQRSFMVPGSSDWKSPYDEVWSLRESVRAEMSVRVDHGNPELRAAIQRAAHIMGFNIVRSDPSYLIVTRFRVEPLTQRDELRSSQGRAWARWYLEIELMEAADDGEILLTVAREGREAHLTQQEVQMLCVRVAKEAAQKAFAEAMHAKVAAFVPDM